MIQFFLKNNTYLCVLLCLTLSISCARVGYPTGGETDKTPPVVLKTTPENKSLNFVSNKFVLEFDEFITLKDINNQLLISPPQKNFPEVTTKGKKVYVEIKDTLLDNTTYNFLFCDAIADNNEGNLLKNYSYVFSTGNTIDSLSFCGTILDAFSMKPEENVFVFLYTNFDDSSVLNTRPTYFAKTDKDGHFRFNYLANNKYKLVAFNDLDKSLTYNNTSEKIAFTRDTIVPILLKDSALPDYSYTLYDFEQVSTKQRLVKNEFVAKGLVQIASIIPMEKPKIETFGTDVYWLLNTTRDTINMWLKNKSLDSIQIFITDTTGINDTLKLKTFNKKDKAGNFLTSNFSNTFPYFDTLRIIFATPIDTIINPDKAIYYHTANDSGFAKIVMNTTTHSHANIFIPIRQSEKYDITIFAKHFYNIYQQTNDTIKINTTITKAEDYGTLFLTFVPQNKTNTYIVQLLSEKDEPVQEQIVVGDKKITFKYLKAGKYKIRAIEDANTNNKWDAGNYWEKQQSENVKIYSKELNIRDGWDFEETFEW